MDVCLMNKQPGPACVKSRKVKDTASSQQRSPSCAHRAPSGSLLAVTTAQASAAVEAAARRLSVRLIAHDAGRATGNRLEEGKPVISPEQMREFNQIYRRQRTATTCDRFISYSEALGRVHTALASAPAGTPLTEVMQSVFER
jgi:hypothetical protein